MTQQRKILLGVLSAALLLVAFLLWPRNAAAPTTTGPNAAMAADPRPESSTQDSAAKFAVPEAARPDQSPAAVSETSGASDVTLPASAASTAGTSAEDSATAAENEKVSSEEVTGTARMYAAHASLRTPEVADPDSAGNRQILSTMVAKALAQPATPPPATANTH